MNVHEFLRGKIIFSIHPQCFPHHILLSDLLNSTHLSMVFPMVSREFHRTSASPGVSEGYPYYSKGDMLIRYHHEGRKWLVAGTEHKGNNCIAYADAQETMHPGYGFLSPGYRLGMRRWGKTQGKTQGKKWRIYGERIYIYIYSEVLHICNENMGFIWGNNATKKHGEYMENTWGK